VTEPLRAIRRPQLLLAWSTGKEDRSARPELRETLLHEMCQMAVIEDGHGPEWQAEMQRVAAMRCPKPGIKKLASLDHIPR
jgi:hypothetical protein